MTTLCHKFFKSVVSLLKFNIFCKKRLGSPKDEGFFRFFVKKGFKSLYRGKN